MPTKDYYETLGVARDAPSDDIKRAYRSLARTHHPDVASDKAGAEHRFKEINEAYEVLSDPNKRAQYDRFGAVGNGASFGQNYGSAGFGDIFDMFFGDMRGGAQQARRAGPARGSDLRYDLEITLEEAFAGTTKEISFSHLAQCETCKGSGAAPGSLILPCDRCSGSGVMRQVRQTPLGQFVTQTTCSACNGEGQRLAQPCPACAGRGRREVERKLSVKAPAGVDDGSRIRISGSGEAGMRGGPAGDLYVYLNVARHPRFKRDGLDTYVDVPISFPQAAMGATIEAPSLEGQLPLAVPAGTQGGTTIRLRGRGMPGVRGGQRGDHHVTVHVVVPNKVNKRQREMLEEYARAGGDNVDERSFLDRVKEAFKPD
ncbi:MAG TPA: molecular chaperone DnaJ [Verrucomicrobiae bacterium]|jgi:molecular chaperone DnaJ|nr:molecular chaperone DnaJ [Verrucomicrobiae bacterium]